MDEGTTYDVWYEDDERTRHKELTLVKYDGSTFQFYNTKNNATEIIPVSRVVRMQGVKNNGENKDDGLRRE